MCSASLNIYLVFIDKTKGGVVLRGTKTLSEVGLSEVTVISCPVWGWMQSGSSLLIARV